MNSPTKMVKFKIIFDITIKGFVSITDFTAYIDNEVKWILQLRICLQIATNIFGTDTVFLDNIRKEQKQKSIQESHYSIQNLLLIVYML